jgi:hypothetical protein
VLENDATYQQNALVLGNTAAAVWRYLYDLDMTSQFVRLEFDVTVTQDFAITLYNSSPQYNNDLSRSYVQLNFAANAITANYSMDISTGSPVVSAPLITNTTLSSYNVLFYISKGGMWDLHIARTSSPVSTLDTHYNFVGFNSVNN